MCSTIWHKMAHTWQSVTKFARTVVGGYGSYDLAYHPRPTYQPAFIGRTRLLRCREVGLRQNSPKSCFCKELHPSGMGRVRALLRATGLTSIRRFSTVRY